MANGVSKRVLNDLFNSKLKAPTEPPKKIRKYAGTYIRDRQFPVLWQGPRVYLLRLAELECPKTVPWDFIGAHAKRCLRNHDQTPERLAERGGLSPAEMVAIVRDQCWSTTRDMSAEDEVRELKELARQYIVLHGLYPKTEGETRSSTSAMNAIVRGDKA